jgi:hypothetical protein
VPVEGLAVPYCMGTVALDDLELVGHVRHGDHAIATGAAVETVVGRDAHPVFWFTVVSES